MTPIDGLKTAENWIEFFKYLFFSYFYLWKACFLNIISGQHIIKNIGILLVLFIILYFVVLKPLFLLYLKFDPNNRNYDKLMAKSKKAKKKIEAYDTKHAKAHHDDGLTDGIIGENECYKVLKSKFKKDNVFQSVYVYNNKITHINECDLVVATAKAIYVVEVKNYGMYIVPNNMTNWQCFPIDSFDYPFNKDGTLTSSREYMLDNDKWVRNPVKQCERHIGLLKTALGNCSSNVPIVPIVAFNDRATIIWKGDNIGCLKEHVGTTSNIVKMISKIDKTLTAADAKTMNQIKLFLTNHTKENTDPQIIAKHLNLALEMEGKR